MVVLLIYNVNGRPATLVLHGYEEKTWMALAESANAEVEEAIVTALGPSIQEKRAV